MTDKVIEFPKHKVVRDIPEEHLRARQAKADQKLADAIVDDIVGAIITELDNCMINVESKQFSKDLIMVVDTLKACVYRSFGIDHHLHDFIDSNVSVIEDEVSNLSKEELKEKIDMIVKNLNEAKLKLELDEDGSE